MNKNLQVVISLMVVASMMFGGYLFIASDRASAEEFDNYRQQTDKRFLKQDRRDMIKDLAEMRVIYMDKFGKWRDGVLDKIKIEYMEMLEEKKDIDAELKTIREKKK